MSSDSDSYDGSNQAGILSCRYCPFFTCDDPDLLRQHTKGSHDIDNTVGGASQSGKKSSPANTSPSSSSSYPLSSSSSSEHLTTKVNRSKTQQVPISERSKCPLCEKTYSRSSGVHRHMKKDHPDSIGGATTYTIKTVSRCCPYCGNMYSNLSKHYQHCKKKKTNKRVTSKPTSSATSDGLSIVPAFKEWLQNSKIKKLSTQYLNKLVAKLKRIIICWEEKIPKFKADNLLDPFKTKTILPSLSLYLSQAKTLGDQKDALNAYVNLCDFLIEDGDIKYAANKKIKVHYRIAYKANILTLRQYESKKIKQVDKKQKGQTKMTAEKKARDPEELNYNSERLKLVMSTILQHEKMVSMRQTLVEKSHLWIRKNLKESDVRHFLMSQLWITGAGHRPSAITNMTVQELRDATSTTDPNVKLVDVNNHKTRDIHGPAKIPFVLPELYEASVAYMRAWRWKTKPDGLLFATSGGKPASFKLCIDWLIKTLDVLKTSFSPKELSSLSGGTMRKGWTNWSKKSPNSFIKLIADRVMCHSEVVSNFNYREPTRNEVGQFAGDVIRSIDPAKDIDNHPRNSSDPAEERQGDNNARNSSGSAEEGEVYNDTSESSDSVEEGEIVNPSPPTLPSPQQPTTPNQEAATTQACYRHGSRFSASERNLIRFALSDEDGQLPKTVTSVLVNIAIEKSLEFKNLYDNLVIDRGSKGLANKTLTHSLGRKNLRTHK